MKMIYAPTKWSCAPTVLAMISDKEVEEIFEIIGHDGSEKISNAPEPYCRKAFTLAEIVKAALTIGIALVEYPDIIPVRGILLGKSRNDIPHAVAWSGERIYDPAFGRCSLDSFRHDTFLIALPISDEAREEFCSKK